jgi:hypothetical protein
MERIKTWMYEISVIAAVLFSVTLIFANNLVNWLSTFAVLFTFNHAQIADRLKERQKKMEVPDVECYHKLDKLFVIKEILWITTFIIIGSYAAIVGSVMFALYPLWRKYYRHNFKPI